MLNTNSTDLFILSNAFDVNTEMLVAEIKLLQNNFSKPHIAKYKCENWSKWLTKSNCGRETILPIFLKY